MVDLLEKEREKYIAESTSLEKEQREFAREKREETIAKAIVAIKNMMLFLTILTVVSILGFVYVTFYT